MNYHNWPWERRRGAPWVLVLSFMLFLLAGAGALWSLGDALPPVGTTHRLAILSTPDNGSWTFLHLVEIGRPFPPPAARFSHLPDATIKGAVLGDGAVLAVADNKPGRDRSFGSALFRLESGAETLLLCDQIAYASRPLISPEGRVFVQRGIPGPVKPSEMRVDTLSISEVDPKTGEAKSLWERTGYVAHMAGIYGRSLVVYHVQPSGARLVLVDRETGAETVLLPSLPPYATDFSVTESGTLVFQNRHANRTDTWVIERLDLNSGNLEIVQESLRALAPKAWPKGELSYGYLKRGGGGFPDEKRKALFEIVEIRAFKDDGTISAALAFPPGVSAPDVVLMDPGGAVVGRLRTPPNTRLQVAGFMP